MEIRIAPVTPDALSALDALFCSERTIDGCWCMWFVVPVRQFHEGRSGANRQRFLEMMEEESTPMGLIAYLGDAPVGWCAVGPRRRYRRALTIPSYRGGPPEDDGSVWLVPCLYVRGELRGSSVATRLLDSAVALAQEHGARAIEGMPFSGPDRRTGGDTQVGFEALFRRCGFTAARRPSATRVVMRRDLAPGADASED